MQRISMIIFMTLLIWLCSFCGARTYIVDDSGFANYETIQGAVDAASSGDTIYIKPGEYSEEVILNKSLTIMPLTGETAPIILDGGDSLETAITINSDGCSLQGLSIKNYAGPAIYIKSNGNLVQENAIENGNPALLIRGSSENKILSNTILNSQGAVALWENAGNNSIENNQIASCNVSVLIREAMGNLVSGNTISDAYWGIWLNGAKACRIEENNIESEYYGILLQNSSSIGIDQNAVDIKDSASSPIYDMTSGIALVNSSGIDVLKNDILGGSICLGVSMSRESILSGNTIAGGSNAMFIKDCIMQSITNNSILDTDFGIRTVNLSRSYIRQNRIDRSSTGIDLMISSQNNITENQLSGITDTALQITSCRSNSFSGNAISDSEKGVILVEATGNRLSQNIFNNVSWCLYVESSSREGFDNSIDESNIADSYPLVYLFNRSGGQIEGREMAHLTLAYCDNLTVKKSAITKDALFLYNSRDNIIRENDISSCFGMRLMQSDENEISDNRLLRNRYSGMFLYDSDSNQIAGNNASENRQNGISLLSCRLNTIHDNVMEGNAVTGIWLNFSNENLIYQNNISNSPLGLQVLYSNDNRIFHNNFWGNDEHSQDLDGNNSWDQGNITGGNFWQGHTAKGNPSQNWPRMIKGGDMLDRYPFQDRNGWLLASPSLTSAKVD